MTDKFYFDFKDVIAFVKTLPPTKRSVLRVSTKVFDPLGLLSPFTVGTKILFQTLCKDKVNWDDVLEGTLRQRWNCLVKEFESLTQIRIPRCYHMTEQVLLSQQVHGFSDASEKAYAAVVYLRSMYRNGMVSVRLLASKTRVAPVKTQTIPRLELLGATILARLVYTVLQNFCVKPDVYCWTDSLTVLCWVKNNRHWKQYV